MSDALDSALAVFMTVVGVLILFLAGALPFVIIGGPLVWLLLRWRARRRERRLAAPRETPLGGET